MKQGNHIFLTGFMGSGKTVVGKKLATLMGLHFEDLDKFIESRERLSVQEIFDRHGEAGFRKVESDCLQLLLTQQPASVISLGGGTVCFNDCLDLVKQNGLLLYIELPAKALYKRLANAGRQRPLLKNKTGQELLDFITGKLESRKKYYQQAHITLNGLNLTAQQLHSEILAYKQKHSF